MSRFQRKDPNSPQDAATGDLPPAAPTVARTRAHDAPTGGVEMTEQDLKALRERLQRVQEKRLRVEFDLEQARKDILECEKQAEKFGVHSLEELEDYVARLEEEDRRNMDAFLQQLQEEEHKLADVEQRMKNMEKDIESPVR